MDTFMSLEEFQIRWSAKNPLAKAMRIRHHKLVHAASAIGCTRTTLQRWVEGSINAFGKKAGNKFTKAIASYCGLTVEQARAAWDAWWQERNTWRIAWNDKAMKGFPEARERIAEGTDYVTRSREWDRQLAEEKNPTHSPRAWHPLVDWLKSSGTSPRGLADTLNDRASGPDGKRPGDYGYITVPVVNGWLSGRILPWEDDDDTFDRIFTCLEDVWVSKDALQRTWQAWYDCKLVKANGKFVFSKDKVAAPIVITAKS